MPADVQQLIRQIGRQHTNYRKPGCSLCCLSPAWLRFCAAFISSSFPSVDVKFSDMVLTSSLCRRCRIRRCARWGGRDGGTYLSPLSSFVLIFPMARLARTVVAGLPHHVTQRGNRREAIFFEDGDQEVYRDLLAEQTRKGRGRGVGVLSHAQSCSPHSHSYASGWSRAGSGRSASALHQFRQCPRAMDGAPLSGPVCIGRNGRVASAGGGLLRQPESGASRLGGVCGGLGVV
jgi:hypothetical protein